MLEGRAHDSSLAAEKLEQALRGRARARIEATVALGEALSVRGEVAPIEGRLAAGLEVEVLVLEDGLSTEVKRGENSGRTLREDSVVRECVSAAKIASETRDPARFEARVPVVSSWKREALRVGVVLRDSKTSEVWQALDVALVASGT